MIFRHLLVVFGGVQGLEASVDADQNLDLTDPSVLFDLYLNTCPDQGSRTIRTEVRAKILFEQNFQDIYTVCTTSQWFMVYAACLILMLSY